MMPYLWSTEFMPVNTFACDGAFRHINQSLHVVCIFNINQEFLKRKPFNLTVLNRLIFDRVYGN